MPNQMPENTPEQTNQAHRENQPNGPGPQMESGFEVLLLPPGRFELGQIVATPGALEALDAARISPAELIGRHVMGDWGTVDTEDWRANDRALLEGTRLLSAYELPRTGETVWVITEWDRSATTILAPSEY